MTINLKNKNKETHFSVVNIPTCWHAGFILCLLFLVFNFSKVSANSYQSPTFKLTNPIFSEGGNKISSDKFVEQAVISGPTAIGVSSSTNYIIKSGFQYFDETPPYIKNAMLNDGLENDIDEQTSLHTISANWSGIIDPESGLHKWHPFELKLRRESDNYTWNPLTLTWEKEASFYATSTKITLHNLDLKTSEKYFFELRAFNNLNMASQWIKSDGIKIIPYLSFTIDSKNVSLGELSPLNNYTNEATTTLFVSTNAYRGYKINTRSTNPLTHNIFLDKQIPDWKGTNQEPALWDKDCPQNPDFCGFGYRTSDHDLGEGKLDRFENKYSFAGFNHTINELISDHNGPITGKTGEIKDEKTEITYRVSVTGNEIAGNYATTIIYIISANY